MAYEKGYRKTKPSMPKSVSMRGAVASWKKKLTKGYIPKDEKMKELVESTYQDEGFKTKFRVGININDEIYSGAKPAGIPESLLNTFHSIMKNKNKMYNAILNSEYAVDFFEDMIRMINEKGMNYNKYKFWKWNRTLKSMVQKSADPDNEISVFKIIRFR